MPSSNGLTRHKQTNQMPEKQRSEISQKQRPTTKIMTEIANSIKQINPADIFTRKKTLANL